MSDYTTYQPPPVPGSRVVDDLVVDAVRARSAMGVEKYGTMLMTFNGRDALEDAAQEAVDCAKYLIQCLEEERTLTDGGLTEDQTIVILTSYTMQATMLDADSGELEALLSVLKTRYPLANVCGHKPDTVSLRVPWRYGRPAVFARKLMREINEFRRSRKE